MSEQKEIPMMLPVELDPDPVVAKFLDHWKLALQHQPIEYEYPNLAEVVQKLVDTCDMDEDKLIQNFCAVFNKSWDKLKHQKVSVNIRKVSIPDEHADVPEGTKIEYQVDFTSMDDATCD